MLFSKYNCWKWILILNKEILIIIFFKNKHDSIYESKYTKGKEIYAC